MILAAVSLPRIQNLEVKHMMIVILVFTIFMAALGALLHFASAQSSADEYDVEKQTKGINNSIKINIFNIIIIPIIFCLNIQ